jgi:hypothetical protein
MADSIKIMEISYFSRSKSLIELTSYNIKNVVSLESLTLDLIHGPRCYQGECKSCTPMTTELEADSELDYQNMHSNEVPSRVKLTVLETCSRS